MPQIAKDNTMKNDPAPISEEALLKISKEIAIKFIETGRLTPATFDQVFKTIHATIRNTVNTK